MDSEYRSFSIPKGLSKRAQNIVDSKQFGYRSLSELIVESLRLRIEELEEKLEPEIPA